MNEFRRLADARDTLNIPQFFGESKTGETKNGTPWSYTRQRLGHDGDQIVDFKIGSVNLSSKQYVNAKNPKEGDLKKWVSLNEKPIFKRYIGDKRNPEVDKFDNLIFAKT